MTDAEQIIEEQAAKLRRMLDRVHDLELRLAEYEVTETAEIIGERDMARDQLQALLKGLDVQSIEDAVKLSPGDLFYLGYTHRKAP